MTDCKSKNMLKNRQFSARARPGLPGDFQPEPDAHSPIVLSLIELRAARPECRLLVQTPLKTIRSQPGGPKKAFYFDFIKNQDTND